MTLETGLSAEHTHIVSHEDLALHWGSEMPTLASPTLIGLFEQTCVLVTDKKLPKGKITVGTGFDVVHLAPTPENEVISLLAVLEEVDGSKLRFFVQARDRTGLISSGTHIRGIVDRRRFMEKVARH